MYCTLELYQSIVVVCKLGMYMDDFTLALVAYRYMAVSGVNH